MLSKIKQLFSRQSKGIFTTDEAGFIYWWSWSKEALLKSVTLDFQQSTIKQNIINNLERVKRGLHSLYFGNSPKVRTIITEKDFQNPKGILGSV